MPRKSSRKLSSQVSVDTFCGAALAMLMVVSREELVAAAVKSEFSESTNSATETEQMKQRTESDGAEPEWTPGSRFRDCPDCPEMIVLPSGSFSMGSSTDEEGPSRE